MSERTEERVIAGLAAASRRGWLTGRSRALNAGKIDQIITTVEAGTSKAAVCRTFSVSRLTLIGTLARIGWTRPSGKKGMEQQR